MTKPTPCGDAQAELRLVRARELYSEIWDALTAALRLLKTEGATKGDARIRDELYRQHLKQLQTIQEIEGQLGTASEATGATRTLDLDSARREIRERLAWIRERGGG